MADPIQRAQDDVRKTIIDIGGIVNGVAERVKAIVNDALKAIFDPLGAALQAELQVFGDLTSGLLNNLATVEDIVDKAVEEWSKLGTGGLAAGPGVAQWFAKTLIEAFRSRDDVQAFTGDPPDLKALNEDPPNPPDIGTYLQEFNSGPLLLQFLSRVFFSILTVGSYAGALHSANVRALQQDVAIRNPVEPLGSAELANAVVQNQVSQDWAESQAKRLGLTPELFDIMVKTYGLPPGLSEMLNLLNRGVIDEDTVRQSIAESHTKTKYTDALLNLRYAIPTIAEITHWLTRDAFIDEFVQRYGMDAEYDLSADKANPLFRANAVSQDYIKYIWRSHWTLPSPGAGAEMFYRTAPDGTGEAVALPGGGTTRRIISRDDLQRLYRASGFEPWWRDPLLKIAYNPLNRIDARRLYMADIIDDGEFYRSALNIGYDETTAQLFLTWMQAQKAAAQHAQALKHIAPIMASLRDAYKRGTIGAADLKQQAVDLGEDADVVDVWIAQLDHERETERSGKIRDGVHRMLVAGYITEDDASQRLLDAGFTSPEWMRLRDEWRVDVQFRELSDDAKATRALTRQNVIQAYKDALITRDNAHDHLRDMGYHDDEIELWLELADFEEQQRVATTAREAIHEDYVDQVIDVVTARSQLGDLHVDSDMTEALLRRWTAERRRRVPLISVGQIEASYKNETLPEDKARTLLTQLRYTDDEIGVLIGAWKQDMSISQQRLELEQQRFAFQQQQAAARTATQAEQFQQRTDIAQQRLNQQESFAQAQQARAQEIQVQAAATAFERAQQKQATAIQAASDRQQKTLDAATARQQAAFAERDKLAAAATAARQAAQQAQDARQQRTLQASADRQQAAFQHADAMAAQRERERQAAEVRAQSYKLAAEQRQQQYEQAKEQRINALKIQGELRANRRELEKELRTQAFQQAKVQQQQQFKIEAEQRVSERKAALAAAAAQAESTIANLRVQQAQIQAQSSQDILNQVEQQIQAQIQVLPTGA